MASETCGPGGGYCDRAAPEGHCTSTCKNDLGCGADGLCIGPRGDSGAQSYCFLRCPAPGTQSTCRAGYFCVEQAGVSDGACVPRQGHGSDWFPTRMGSNPNGNAGANGHCEGDALPCLGSSPYTCTERGCSWDSRGAVCRTQTRFCSDFESAEACSGRSGCTWVVQ